jgi:hypothetical protein
MKIYKITEAALFDLFNTHTQAVIGEDEPPYKDGRMNFETGRVESPSRIRNKLRAEQRSKLAAMEGK